LRTLVTFGGGADFFTEFKGEEIFRDLSQEVIIQFAIYQRVDMPPVVENRVNRGESDVPSCGEFLTAKDLFQVELIDVIGDGKEPPKPLLSAGLHNRLDVLQDLLEVKPMNSIIGALRKTRHGEKNELEVSDKRLVNRGHSGGIGAETIGEFSLVENEQEFRQPRVKEGFPPIV